MFPLSTPFEEGLSRTAATSFAPSKLTMSQRCAHPRPCGCLGKSTQSARDQDGVCPEKGSDELFAGYLYNLYCPSEAAMVQECKHISWQQLHAYDCQTGEHNDYGRLGRRNTRAFPRQRRRGVCDEQAAPRSTNCLGPIRTGPNRKNGS